MPKMHVDKSILIRKAPKDVYAVLTDFNHWSAWSPWLIVEKDVTVNVSDDGKYYEWSGDLVGAGNMKITSEKSNKQIDIDLTFLKPWKSKAKITLTLEKEGDYTCMHWIMDSSLPFFMFFMKKMMSTYIGMDFERGLSMLKDYIEEGEVPSKLNFPGVSEYKGCEYIAIKTTCTIDDLGETMQNDFEQLMKFMEDKRDLMSAEAVSIYHKWNPVKNSVTYSAALPVSKVPEDLPENIVLGTIPTTKVYRVEHEGPYRHIGNAWSAQFSRERAKKFKKNKRIDPFEVYLNSPKDTPEKELRSDVCFPVL